MELIKKTVGKTNYNVNLNEEEINFLICLLGGNRDEIEKLVNKYMGNYGNKHEALVFLKNDGSYSIFSPLVDMKEE